MQIVDLEILKLSDKKTRAPSQEPYLVLVFQLITGEKPHFLSH